MKESFRSNKRSKHRSSGPNGVVIGLSIGGGLFVLLTVGLVLYAVLGLLADTTLRFIERKALTWRRTLEG